MKTGKVEIQVGRHQRAEGLLCHPEGLTLRYTIKEGRGIFLCELEGGNASQLLR